MDSFLSAGEVSSSDDGPFIATAIALDDDDYMAPPPPKKRKIHRKKPKTTEVNLDHHLTPEEVESRLHSLSDLRLATSLLLPHQDHHWEVLRYFFHMKSPVDGIAAVIAQTRWVYWGLWDNDVFMYRSFQRFSEVRDFLVEYPKLWPTIVKERVLDPKVLKPKRSVDDFNRANFTKTGVTRHTKKIRNDSSISVSPDWSASSLTHRKPPTQPTPIPLSSPFQSSPSTLVETLSLFPPQPYNPPPSHMYQTPPPPSPTPPLPPPPPPPHGSPPLPVRASLPNQSAYFGTPYLDQSPLSLGTLSEEKGVPPREIGIGGATVEAGDVAVMSSTLKRSRSTPSQTTPPSNEKTTKLSSPRRKDSESRDRAQAESESSVSSRKNRKRTPAGEGEKNQGQKKKKKKKRAPFRRSQLLLLEGSFESSPFSTRAEMDRLVLETGLSRSQIIMWFANRRRQRNKRQGVPRFQWSK